MRKTTAKMGGLCEERSEKAEEEKANNRAQWKQITKVAVHRNDQNCCRCSPTKGEQEEEQDGSSITISSNIALVFRHRTTGSYHLYSKDMLSRIISCCALAVGFENDYMISLLTEEDRSY